MHIIIGKKSERFVPHFNRATGKKYYCSSDYVADLKRMKLEPYREIEKPKSKPYVMSPEGREMVKQAAAYERRKEKPGSRFIKALNEVGIARKPKWLTDAESLVGGFKQGEVD